MKNYKKNMKKIKGIVSNVSNKLQNNNFLRYTVTVFSSVAIIVLGIVILAHANSVTTTIGENISTNNLTATGLNVNGNATTTGNLNVDTNTLYVDSENNRVGIGTTNPEVLLHLEGGNMALGDTSSGDHDAVIYFADDGNAKAHNLKWQDRDDRFVFSSGLQAKGYVNSVTKPMPFGVWRRQGVVLTAGAGEPDKAEEPNVMYEDGIFKMWYKEGGWGTPAHINYATSSDGINWSSYAGNPVINKAIRPVIMKKDGIYYLYATNYEVDGPKLTQFKLYTSTDGINFTFDSLVLESGATGEWDSISIKCGFVWVEGTNDWKMLYEGYGPVGGVNRYRTGLATSSDGRHWTKSESNPVISRDERRGIGGTLWVKKIGSYYYLWSGNASLPADIYRMRSTDLITWEDYPSAPVFVRQGDDEGEFSNRGQAVDSYLLEHDNKVYLYYCGQSDGSDVTKNAYIKLAIADMPIEDLVATNEDAGSFYVDNVNKRIGIGDTAPAATLEIIDRGDDIFKISSAMDSPGDYVTVDTAGNVGIGTTSPNALLDVAGTSKFGGIINTNNNWISGDGEAEGLSIDDDGNVGIGTAEAGYPLDVYSNSAIQGRFYGYSSVAGVAAAGSGSILLGSNTGWQGMMDYDATGQTTFYIGNTYDSAAGSVKFRMRSAGTPVDVMTILGSGNVGIGTTSPVTKLDVDGIIKTAPRNSAICNSDSEGGIYYDSDDNHFYGCNGSSWVQLDYNP